MTFEIIRTVQREKTYEYWLRIKDDSGNIIIDNYIFSPHASEPLPLPALTALIKTQVYPQLTAAPEPPDTVFTAEEVAAILIEYGILSEGQVFPDDLPSIGSGLPEE